MTLLIVSLIVAALICLAVLQHKEKEAEANLNFERKIKRLYDKTTRDWELFILEEKVKEERNNNDNK